MRGTVVKRIRKDVYDDMAPRERRYFRNSVTDQVTADTFRQAYQAEKKAHLKGA